MSRHTLTRRGALQMGSLGLAGLSLPDLLSASPGQTPRAKSCILLFMWGGPSHLDTWDLKPDAPIDTTVPGLRISEHFPLLAKVAHHATVVRSMTHDDPAHLSSVHHLMTGHLAPKPKSDAEPPSRNDTPHIGSMLAHLRPAGAELPPFVSMPWVVAHPAAPGGKAPGQNGGWLGQGYDPFVVEGTQAAGKLNVPGMATDGAMTPERLSGRKSLLDSLGEGMPGGVHERAFSLLTSPAARSAFDLERESPQVRDRYGRHLHGQCCLMARRLVEAGVRLVCVNWPNDGKNFWDTHGDNFNQLKKRLMPPSDRAFSALLEDLDQRGMLTEDFSTRPSLRGSASSDASRPSRGTTRAANTGRDVTQQSWPAAPFAAARSTGVRTRPVIGRVTARCRRRTSRRPCSTPWV